VKLNLSSFEEAEGKRSKKKGNTSTPNLEERQEALAVLTDFLISLLTKPQSFLRDVANFTFKQFCTEVPAASL
jgi:DNA polymerase phi